MPVDQAEEWRKKREAALLEKWAAGKRLSPGEQAEIAHLMPRAPDPKPELALEAQVVGEVEKPSLTRDQVERYMTMYAQSDRNIFRWHAKKAPMDRPGEMPTWWAATMKHRVPPRLLELATAAKAAGVVAASGPRAAPEVVAPGAPDGEVGRLSPLEQTRAVADDAYAKLQAAMAGGDAGAIALAQRVFKDASEQLRRTELSEPKIRIMAGKTVDREKLRSMLSEMHTSIAQTWRSFSKRMRRETMGKPAAEQETIWQTETDKVFARFRDCEFADAVA
jgi:hypothetical protein